MSITNKGRKQNETNKEYYIYTFKDITCKQYYILVYDFYKKFKKKKRLHMTIGDFTLV